jgi:hypothetical protein
MPNQALEVAIKFLSAMNMYSFTFFNSLFEENKIASINWNVYVNKQAWLLEGKHYHTQTKKY